MFWIDNISLSDPMFMFGDELLRMYQKEASGQGGYIPLKGYNLKRCLQKDTKWGNSLR